MRTASGLTLLGAGAVLAFAVHGHPWFLDLQAAGWILMIVAVLGLVIPRRGYGWVRRRLVRPGWWPVAKDQFWPPAPENPDSPVTGGRPAEDDTTEMPPVPPVPADSDA
jgi:hypothetical protein